MSEQLPLFQDVQPVPCGTRKGVLYDAVFSTCRKYRYSLWRQWANTDYVLFIGLNPSTATEFVDDPTIRRCMDFAQGFGGGALCMANIFAWRDTDPRKMKAAADPIGPDNDDALLKLAKSARLVIAAWGVHGSHLQRSQRVIELLSGVCTLYCLGKTKDGFPKHPLYLPKNSRPMPLL